jgi:hypothetical protein
MQEILILKEPLSMVSSAITCIELGSIRYNPSAILMTTKNYGKRERDFLYID